ncbi:hypothetical protein K8R33_03095 [archaeon]|nr:hypothetical protein [archaeon]
MYENLLTEAGLTNSEAKVYLALLKIGKSQSGNIIKEAKISSGKIYEILEKLTNKGLVETVTENGVKQFIASEPKTILDYMKDKEQDIITKTKKLEKIIPDLQKIKKPEILENVYLIRGFRGIEPIMHEILENTRDEIKIMGIRSSKNRKFNAFWLRWHKKRIKLRREVRALFSDRNTTYWKEFKKMKFTTTKSLETLSPSAIMIIGNHSFIFSYEEEFTCIHIISKQTANSFNSFFNSLWKIAKP